MGMGMSAEIQGLLYGSALDCAEKSAMLGLFHLSELTRSTPGMATPHDTKPAVYEPYISDEAGKGMKEFTWSSVIVGTLLGVVLSLIHI